MSALTRNEVETWPATGPMALKAERVLALFDELANLRCELALTRAALANAEAQRDAACAEAASLRAVLSGKHDGRCADAKQGNGSGPCDCGSDAALAAPSTAEQALRDRDERVRADERAAMWGDRENIERVLAGQPVAHVFSAGGMAEHDAKVRVAALEEAAHAAAEARPQDGYQCGRDAMEAFHVGARQAAVAVRALAQLHPPGRATMPSEWEHSSCGSCGLDDVPCAIDGIVWTCRECWPTGKAAR